jgi:hypothetical protein
VRRAHKYQGWSSALAFTAVAGLRGEFANGLAADFCDNRAVYG